jgi:hypothetical protein
MAAGVALFMGEGRMCQRLLIKAALLDVPLEFLQESFDPL